MTDTKDLSWDDSVLPFQLERSGTRGRVARLGSTLEHILSRHDYPVAVSAMLAELTTLTALIGQTIKLRWKLSLQVRGNGAIRTLAADYYAPETKGGPARMRAWASFDAERLHPEAPGFDQLGQGYFAVLIDQGEGTTPYQGLTPLSGGSLASCAQTYFEQSEQLPTRFELTTGRSRMAGTQGEHWRAGGVMLQTLPATSHAEPQGEALDSADILQGAQSEDWTRSTMLMSTVEAIELVDPNLPLPTLVFRLFHEEQPTSFAPQPLVFGCSCNPERVRGTLSIYSQKDIGHMTTEEGIVTADCQFCGAHYEFDPKSLGFEATVDADGQPLPPKSRASESRTPESGPAETRAAETRPPETRASH